MAASILSVVQEGDDVEEDTLDPVVIAGWSITRHGRYSKTSRSLSIRAVISSPMLHCFEDGVPRVLSFSFGEDSNCGTGGWLWHAAPLLARHLTDASVYSPGFFHDKTVLELGAGIGFISLLLAALGARVVASDVAHVVSPVLQTNLCANIASMPHQPGRAAELPLDVVAAVVHWSEDFARTDAVAPDGLARRYDFVLASDCLKCAEYVAPLAATVRFFSDSDTVVLFSYEERGLHALDLFWAELSTTHDWTELEGRSSGGGLAVGDRAIWRMQKKRS